MWLLRFICDRIVIAYYKWTLIRLKREQALLREELRIKDAYLARCEELNLIPKDEPGSDAK